MNRNPHVRFISRYRNVIDYGVTLPGGDATEFRVSRSDDGQYRSHSVGPGELLQAIRAIKAFRAAEHEQFLAWAKAHDIPAPIVNALVAEHEKELAQEARAEHANLC